MSTRLLELQELSMYFGGIHAVDSVNLHIEENEVIALIGPNGAGKTTVFNCTTGMYTPTTGKVMISSPNVRKQEDIADCRPDVIAKKGLARTFQNIRLFLEMTTLENVMVAYHIHLKSTIWDVLFGGSKVRKEESHMVKKAYEYMGMVGIAKYAHELSKNLPYGVQRKLEIARALATKPFLLLLDEPAAGMNPKETEELRNIIISLRKQVSIFLIEHDMSLVMTLADRVYVMDHGKMIAHGRPEEIKQNPEVIRAYLGGDYA